jgi:hypothetical protein
MPDQDTPAAPTGGTRAAPKRGRADSTGAGASASANARDIAGGWLACGPHNADACGPHNAGRMQTCEQTGGENGTGHVDNGTTHDTDTVKGMTWAPVVMPSASLALSVHIWATFLPTALPEAKGAPQGL